MRLAGYHRRDLQVAALGLAALLAWDLLAQDLPLTRLFGTAQGFAWRDHTLTRGLLHDGGRLLAGAVLLAMLANTVRPWTPRLATADRLRWLGATLLALAIVPLLKQLSATSCPWSLAEFGGVAQHVPHWTSWMNGRLGDGGPGGCFPSGHATSAAAFFSGWFALREPHPRLARAWLAATLVLALLYGAAQLVRGAHYASHTLWSAWLCWVLALALLGRAPAGARAPRPA